jgi:hypothetical protein
MTEGRSYSDLATLNCELGLPVQGPHEVIFNSAIGRACQLIPFELQALELPQSPFMAYPHLLHEEYLTLWANTFPSKYVSLSTVVSIPTGILSPLPLSNQASPVGKYL